MRSIIPEDLNEWDIDKLNELIRLRDVERETFDFKGPDFKKLYEHICAFANYSSRGFIVLGITEDKGQSNYTKQYKKVGFEDDREDWIRNEINNCMVRVDPIPNVRIKYLHDKRRIYPVLQIEGDDYLKPYLIKDNGQCFIRTGASSSPASRTTIINLFNNLVTRRHGVERLRISLTLLGESLMHMSELLDDAHPFLPPLELDYVRNAVLDTEWFLIQNKEFGGHDKDKPGSYTHGIHSFLHKIEMLNISISNYNRTSGAPDKRDIIPELRHWEPNREEYTYVLRYINKVCLKCNEFLLKFR